MLRTESVASLLQKKLNEFGEKTDPAYSFKLFAEVGKGDHDGNDLIGMVYAKKGLPRKNKYYVHVEYAYLCKIMVPISLSNFDVIRVKAIIDDFIQENNGSEVDIDGGKGVFTFETSESEQLRTEGGFGKCVPVGFSIKIKYTKNREGQVKYYLGLCDTQFDNNSVNTRYFEATKTKSAKRVQIEYWEEKIRNGCVYEEIAAPNLDSIDIVSQEYKNSKGYELYDLTNKNYAVVKVEKNGLPIKYYYYFVTNTRIGTLNRVVFDLKLDTIQTYFFEDNIEFSDCLIHRAHLNRWIDNGDGTVSFDGSVTSKLFEREDIQDVSKRLTKRTQLSLYSSFPEQIKEWFDNNVECWGYAFIDPTHTFVVAEEQELNPVALLINGKNKSSMITNLACICFPIYKNGLQKIIQINGGAWTYASYQTFTNLNEGFKHVYSNKISIVPPFVYDDIIGTLSIDSNGNLNWSGMFGLKGEVFNVYKNDNNGMKWNLVSLFEQSADFLTEQYSLSDYFTFEKSEIIGVEKTPKFNPKLLNSDYKSLKICDHTENGFEYDLQKLNMQTITLNYSEPLNSDLTKGYLRIKNPSGIYIAQTEENLTGCILSNDNALPILTTEYQAMLAHQKNYFTQANLSIEQSQTNAGMGLVKNVAGQLMNGNLGGAVSDLFFGSAGMVINQGYAKKQLALTEDNMKNAPSTIQGARGNIIMNAMQTSLGIYIEEFDILEAEKEIINDSMNLFGFTYNQIDNIKSLCVIRKYHNYIQGELDSISGVSISNAARIDLRQRFANGIRFWNSDNIQYELENYERWLEE